MFYNEQQLVCFPLSVYVPLLSLILLWLPFFCLVLLDIILYIRNKSRKNCYAPWSFEQYNFSRDLLHINPPGLFLIVKIFHCLCLFLLYTYESVLFYWMQLFVSSKENDGFSRNLRRRLHVRHRTAPSDMAPYLNYFTLDYPLWSWFFPILVQ